MRRGLRFGSVLGFVGWWWGGCWGGGAGEGGAECVFPPRSGSLCGGSCASARFRIVSRVAEGVDVLELLVDGLGQREGIQAGAQGFELGDRLWVGLGTLDHALH